MLASWCGHVELTASSLLDAESTLTTRSECVGICKSCATVALNLMSEMISKAQYVYTILDPYRIGNCIVQYLLGAEKSESIPSQFIKKKGRLFWKNLMYIELSNYYTTQFTLISMNATTTP